MNRTNSRNYNRFVQNYTNQQKNISVYNSYATVPVNSSVVNGNGTNNKKRANPQLKKTVQKKYQRRKRTVFKYKEDNIRGISPRTAISIGLIFAGLLCVCISFAISWGTQLRIASLNEDLQKIEDENRILMTEISENYDLVTIEKIATTKLGMNKPKPSQIVYIEVPSQSYVIQYNPNNTDNIKSGLLKIISDFLTSLGFS